MRQRIVDLLTGWPRTSLFVWLVLTLVLFWGIRWLKFDFSPESVYAGQDEAVAFCERHKQLFRFEDSICLIVLEATDGRSLVRSDSFDWLGKFERAARQIPGVQSVTSLLTIQRPVINTNPTSDGRRQPLDWAPLISAVDLRSDEAINERLDRLPLLNDLLISSNRRLILTLVVLDPAKRGMSQILPIVQNLERVVAATPVPSGARVRISGVPPIRVDIVRSLQQDQLLMVPACASLFLFISLLLFRSLPVMLVCLFAVVTPVMMTVGLMGWLGQSFNLLSNIVPPLALIIAAANAVHIVSRLQYVVQQPGAAPRDATAAVMHEMLVTCFLTLFTTGIGFGSLWLARSTLLQQLAVQSLTAMICNYFALMIVLTSGLTLTAPRMQRVDRDSRISRWLRGLDQQGLSLLQGLAVRISRNARSIIVLLGLISAAAFYSAQELRINSLMFETYDAEHPVMETIELLDSQLSGMVSLEMQLRADSADVFFRPDVVEGIRRLRTRLEHDPRMTFWRDYTQVLESFDSRTASRSADVSSEAFRRISRMMQRMDLSRLTRDFLATEEPAARIMMRVHDIGSAGLNDLIAEVNREAAATLPEDLQFFVTGDAALHAICMDAFVRDLFLSLTTASGSIFLMIAVTFRSVRVGLVSVFPNLMPLLLTLAWMRFRGLELTAGNVIVFAISVGIAVDDTIHFLARFREEFRGAVTLQDAVQLTVLRAGKAIILTSVLIVTGLSILVFSEFIPTRRFAELTAVTMLAALPGDLILLPALLRLWGGQPSETSEAAGSENQQRDPITRVP